MLCHGAPEAFPSAGIVGVVVFFALSGYLITSLLVDELERTGRVDLRAFYLRRARRLVPALLAMVAGVIGVTVALDPIGDRHLLARTVAIAVTWTGDLPFGHASPATFHLWTLAVEEQRYLVWPIVLALVVPRRPRLALAAVGTACALACLATTLWFQAAPDLAYSLPTSWAGCLAIGATARMCQDRITVPHRGPRLALSALVLLGVVPWRGRTLTYLVGGPTIAVLAVALVLGWRSWTDIAVPAPGWVGAWRATGARVLVRLGTVSYAAYLWNYPLTIWMLPHLGAAAGATAAITTLVAAAVSWRVVERPFRRPRAPVLAVR